MARNIVDAIKRASIAANEASQPTDLRYGTVTSENPLEIRISSNYILPESVLVVPQHLTDYELKVTIKDEYEWKTEPQYMSLEEVGQYELLTHSHDHDIKIDEKKIKVHGALKIGDKVALLRAAGGQSFYILDRLPKDGG